jgi:hypothetical protein
MLEGVGVDPHRNLSDLLSVRGTGTQWEPPMRVVTHCASSTVGLRPSVAQVESAFGRVVAERASCLPEFELLTRLGIFTSIGPWNNKPKRSSRQGAYYIIVPVPYKAWIAADWPTRVDLMAAAFLAGLEEVPQKRLLDSERSALRNIAESTRVDARSSPPARVEKIVPTVVDISPVAPVEERSFKLYKRIDCRLHYRESWIGDHHVVTEHWGACGERGTVRTHGSDSATAARVKYKSLKAKARAMGFRRIPQSRHATLVVELAIKDMGERADLSRRHALEKFLDEQTGWLGLGHCDGGSSGSGSMEAFCLVVDFAVAETALMAILHNSPFSNFTRIYRLPR